MNDTAELLEFNDRAEYRNWLNDNHHSENGVWLLFTKGSKSFTALDALEEAICFGWIDGLMKSIDEKTYKKYFSKRKDVKKWSDKNIAIFEKLIKNGLMTDAGIKVCQADTESKKKPADMNEKITLLEAALQDNTEAANLFKSKSPSKQKQFAGFYCEAKTGETRQKRKDKIIDALLNNYTGMLY